MKRYEKMSKEEIIEQYKHSYTGCNQCVVHEIKGMDYNCEGCVNAITDVLNEEIETIPRAWTFKTSEEASIAYDKFNREYCGNARGCETCRYITNFSHNYCQLNWLYELIEKEETK